MRKVTIKIGLAIGFFAILLASFSTAKASVTRREITKINADIAKLRACVRVVRGMNPAARFRADARRGDRKYYTEWSSGYSFASSAPGIAECRPKGRYDAKDTVAGFPTSDQKVQSIPFLANECAFAIRDFKAQYNQLMAKIYPATLKNNCEGAARIDDRYRPFDWGKHFAQLTKTRAIYRSRGLPMPLTSKVIDPPITAAYFRNYSVRSPPKRTVR